MADQATREYDRSRGLSYCNKVQNVVKKIDNAVAELNSFKAKGYKENWKGESGDAMEMVLENMIRDLSALKTNLSALAGNMKAQVSWAYNTWPEDDGGM